MSVTLTQSASAAMPDRPRHSTGTGLLVTCAQGDGGAYLQHDLGSEQTVLHVRLALNPGNTSGGAVRIAGGCDSQRNEVWWLDYDADNRAVSAALADGTTLTAMLNALPWHTVELKVDAATGEAKLWINGLAADTASGTYSDLAAQHVWLGAVFKDTALTGALQLDEWALADAHIGPVLAPTISDHADDPARWLVIYNTAVPDSVAWADSYRAARGVPFANLLGLDLSTNEVIDSNEYIDLVNASNNYLARTGLDSRIMGVLTGYRVPGYVDYDGAGVLDPVPALLQTGSTSDDPPDNPLAADALPDRPLFGDLAGARMTARVDGPDLASAQALTTRATNLINNGFGDPDSAVYGENATLWFDPFAGSSALIAPHITRMLDWAQSIDRMRLRLPFEYSGDPDQPEQDANFAAIHSDAFLWSWDRTSPPDPPEGFFADPAGPRVLSVQLHAIDPTATTVRSATPGNWLDLALDAGYAAAVAGSKSYSTSAIPFTRPLFEALRHGWTLGEAWHLSLPLLREGLYLVGDPLLTIALPRRGWDVYGPLDRLESLDPSSPVQGLREPSTQLALDSTLQPAADQTRLYMVRHVDAHGRRESSAATVRIHNHGGLAAPPPRAPIWPDQLDWPVRIEQAALQLQLMWDRPIAACHAAKIELRGIVDGAAEVTLAEPTIDPRRTTVEATLPLPAQQGQYRWRITSPDGVVLQTPWSQPVTPRESPNIALTVLEARP